MQYHYFNSESYKLAARLYVANQAAPTLLLLHGLGFYSFEYERLAPLLTAGGFNCFTFDFRSHGASQGKRGSWTLNDLVKDTQNAMNYLEKLGYKGFGIFGNSLGATVAVFAAAADQRIKTIVACNVLPNHRLNYSVLFEKRCFLLSAYCLSLLGSM
jgi:alpha-beta hydrolase superfamily lysophospholipase